MVPDESIAIRIRASMCLTRGGEMLFVQHAKRDHTYWLLPGGGVEVGETMREAAEREVLEETGHTTRVGQLLVVCEAIEPAERHLINVVFAGTVTGGELTPGRDGTLVDAAWQPRDAIASLEMHPWIGDALLACWAEDFRGPARFLGNVWRERRATE